jgi:hypothetical protein
VQRAVFRTINGAEKNVANTALCLTVPQHTGAGPRTPVAAKLPGADGGSAPLASSWLRLRGPSAEVLGGDPTVRVHTWR